LASAENLDVIKILIELYVTSAFFDVVGQSLWGNPSEVLSISLSQSPLILDTDKLLLLLAAVNQGFDVRELRIRWGTHSCLIFVTVALSQWQQIQARRDLFAIAYHNNNAN